jgi:hypothetical protein
MEIILVLMLDTQPIQRLTLDTQLIQLINLVTIPILIKGIQILMETIQIHMEIILVVMLDTQPIQHLILM